MKTIIIESFLKVWCAVHLDKIDGDGYESFMWPVQKVNQELQY